MAFCLLLAWAPAVTEMRLLMEPLSDVEDGYTDDDIAAWVSVAA